MKLIGRGWISLRPGLLPKKSGPARAGPLNHFSLNGQIIKTKPAIWAKFATICSASIQSSIIILPDQPGSWSDFCCRYHQPSPVDHA